MGEVTPLPYARYPSNNPSGGRFSTGCGTRNVPSFPTLSEVWLRCGCVEPRNVRPVRKVMTYTDILYEKSGGIASTITMNRRPAGAQRLPPVDGRRDDRGVPGRRVGGRTTTSAYGHPPTATGARATRRSPAAATRRCAARTATRTTWSGPLAGHTNEAPHHGAAHRHPHDPQAGSEARRSERLCHRRRARAARHPEGTCDLSLASENAIFGQSGPRVGRLRFDAQGFGTVFLARIVGEKKAREIWYLCRQYSAQEALEMGLVNRGGAAGAS